jgi:uncharacterized protein YecE (DUF72 family)
MMKIRVGIGGWNFPEWRGGFYPKGLNQKQELSFAASKLNTIEINATYYGSQKPESFAKWHAETPQGFVFAVKGPRFATNRRVLADAEPSIAQFLASGVLNLKEKLGPINWQFSEYKKFEPDDFAKFIALLPKSVEGHPIQHALEVRNATFNDRDFIALARAHDMAVVTSADSDFPQINDVTAPFVYARIMGTKENEEQGYAKSDLKKWAARASQWSQGQTPDGFETMALPGDGKPRDVFLYVISGAKAKNPHAAMGIMQHLAVA